MDHNDHQIHSLDICNRFYNFVTKIVSAHAFKTVKLGHPTLQNFAKPRSGAIHEGEEPGCEDVKRDDSLKKFDSFDSSFSSAVHDSDDRLGTRSQEEAPLPCSPVAQAKPAKIKKNVSINDRVEEIHTRKKMKRRESTEKLPSLDIEEDTVQPVKSILKKDSFHHCHLAERSIFFIHSD
ncbi:hypothetical protein OIU74_021075 [Salix koriyanagi]|uniref:Uncharacterized protein n=1 Tax=Salix koriyanagi TaxID=2511006 RepID=A0A9Q0P783_9ROSI|nr:hypothetical protein OIU74_021075 [Salix koriyanagi]